VSDKERKKCGHNSSMSLLYLSFFYISTSVTTLVISLIFWFVLLSIKLYIYLHLSVHCIFLSDNYTTLWISHSVSTKILVKLHLNIFHHLHLFLKIIIFPNLFLSCTYFNCLFLHVSLSFFCFILNFSIKNFLFLFLFLFAFLFLFMPPSNGITKPNESIKSFIYCLFTASP